MTQRIFIDGQAGTTGLEIHARLRRQPDLELLEIDPAERKNPEARKALLNAADLVILCLPDAAAREAVALIDSDSVKVLDASTAHRIAPGWTYGLPELAPGQRQAVAESRLVANPGCYPTGFLLLVRPLVDAGLISAEQALSVHAQSGYTGGGRSMVERYEALEAKGIHLPPRPYALGLAHKHQPEMKALAGLANAPLFAPSVGHHARGMLVSVPLPGGSAGLDAAAVTRAWEARYADEACVHLHAPGAEASLVDGGFLDPEGRNGTNGVDLMVFGNGPDLMLTARLDNLGKGAGGAAVQNLNLMLGRPELSGLEPSKSGTPDLADAAAE